MIRVRGTVRRDRLRSRPRGGRPRRARGWRCLLVATLALVGGAETGLPDSRSSLKLLMEVRYRIHQDYVDEVDSLRVIAGAIDGLVAALPEGENIYISPAEMAEVGYDPGPRALGDREQLQLLSEAFRQVRRQ